ncbi:ATP-dependent protease ATPase subunit HslU [Macrococcus brunensis]|uniref:ATP-dependent protease ATPase subunit HslU n=1 Tax=Macrococcus brunensis TaxID=198483 RepID=A0A4R6BDB3_9STAP|nr:ATP-dependent protease ATPase subunit HslU [Macrococcus brunensis]TDL97750.1 ATP-dependent protease ATPase subunit HslU [Macrococcus brunensis]ULG72901.1 ATP-dependent protease ATPase subunit HslU [Macrococcus brunensis]ULG75149.1 ATP-dependent protease ATPase subunit HslU [Macrococcus brunensis]
MNQKLKLTPKEIVAELNAHIVGQEEAKKKVAISLRNRYRRSKLDDQLQQEIIPKNILMMGPTGVGKTEIARRIARLVGAPFVKVEATKYTEVGYVGRDVESMIRDLVENGIRLVKEEKKKEVLDEATKQADERLVQLLVPAIKKKKQSGSNPFEALFSGQMPMMDLPEEEEVTPEVSTKRQDIRRRLLAGELEEEVIKIKVEQEQSLPFGMDMPGNNMQDMLSQMMPKKKVERTLTVQKARPILIDEEAGKLIDQESVNQEAVQLTEQLGIVFIDEIDKIAGSSERGQDISRQGVQRDILPIVEGSVVQTKYGAVNTEHILFIGAGAFHVSKPSDLIPELQGRFPIRVELNKLSVEDFEKILREPKLSLLRQYESLLATEDVTISFTDEAITRLAEIAFEVNQETDNIGARRLHTIMEKMLEDLSFEAPEMPNAHVEITKQYVESKLGSIAKNKNLSEFIL